MHFLGSRGHTVFFQENSPHRYSNPSNIRYFFYRGNYLVQSIFHEYQDFDIIFASKVENAPLAYLLSKKLDKPFIIDADDLERIGTLDFKGNCTDFLLRKSEKVFAASIALYNLYKQNGNAVTYLPNSTNLEYFDPSRFISNQNHSEPTFLWVSDKIDWVTACKLIFPSFKKLTEGHLIIIGSGPKQYFRELSERLGISHRVTVKDWVPEAELPYLYSCADFGLLPFSDTLWAQCKCPSRIFEFMAMEVPFICTVGEPSYIATKINCGIISKPNVEDFYAKMQYAISNIDKLKQLGKKGREFLLKEQTFSQIGAKLEFEIRASVNKD